MYYKSGNPVYKKKKKKTLCTISLETLYIKKKKKEGSQFKNYYIL